MRFSRTIGLMASAAMLASCGGGDGSSNPGPIGGGGGGGGGDTTCSLSARQDWALGVLQEWYLFPDKLDTSVNKNDHTTLQSYIDALVAPAREEGIDRNFTYVTSIEEENDFIENGSTADYGWRPTLASGNRLFLRETFETAPAFGAGIDRGTEIVRLGLSAGTLRTPAEIISANGIGFLSDLVFPDDEGVTLFLEIDNGGGIVSTSITSAEYELEAISPRYGVEIFGSTGYLNLRTFFASTAEEDLTDAFQQFGAAGVTDIVIDLRYNGGGLVSVAEHLGDLLGQNRSGQVFSRTTFRSSKSANNSTELFQPFSASRDPVRIAFITTGSSASASELIANSMLSYYGNDTALVGSDTFGKPVGQIAIDRAACDDRLRVVAFRTENADGQGDYYNGLASVYSNTCAASDDIFTPLGNATEPSIAKALDFVNSGAGVCTPISAAKGTRSVTYDLAPRNPSIAQRVIAGQL
ncbi:S41 family peptidase [Sphingomicrobium flavum]|uniref:S41 family peptidase n=1 Tax=Sphingomicrobium flavum TaxID=1229164 RepID=UPI0021AD89DA|nr:S41 family peptidase [Sphingomicrobium flavum]